MAQKKKSSKSGSWKKERASVNSKSNKYRPGSDQSERPDESTHYWRAGYTRKDGTHVKGHYVRNPNS
jgi:hypothetical protein